MMSGALPPSSSDTFLRFPADAAAIFLPTSVEPVNATLSTLRCATSAAPVSTNPATTPTGSRRVYARYSLPGTDIGMVMPSILLAHPAKYRNTSAVVAMSPSRAAATILPLSSDSSWASSSAFSSMRSAIRQSSRPRSRGVVRLHGDPYSKAARAARTSPILDELAQATGETVHLGRLEGDHIVYTAKRESSHPLRMYSAVGRRLPAYVTAMGRALLADRSPEDLEALVPEVLAPLTARTTVDRAKLNGILDAARATGFAIENEESCIGIACFAISLPFASPAVDAISIAVPISRLDDDVRSLVIEQLLAVRTRLQLSLIHI